MDFDLSKPQKLLKESARDFLARECKPERVRALMESDTAFDPALWQAMADQGWMGLVIPEAYGGLGLGVVELAAVAEEMGRACLPGPFLSTLYASALLARAGTAEQKARYLEPIAAGECKATVAFPGELVLDAGVADVILWVERDGFRVIPRESKGLTLRRRPAMDETRKLYEVSLEGGPAAEGGGAAAIAAATDLATVALCAEMVGGMQWVLDTTVEYAKTRQQFGRPIGSFQAVQHQCADMLLMTESSRSATYYAAWALTESDPAAPVAVSVAKAYASDAYREVSARGIQIHGGIGFTWEHNLHIYFRRSKGSETLFGDPEYHRERIARYVVDGAPSPVKQQAEAAAVAAAG